MKNIIIIIITLFAVNIFSQNQISGIVTDENNGKPLSNVTIYATEINKVINTDKNGEYLLKDIPNGKLKIQFSLIGYINHVEIILFDNSSRKINVALENAMIKTEEIVVTSGYNSTQHENAVKIDVFNIDDVLKNATPNFMETITSVPGVDMISKGSGVSKPVIRGLSMNDILVLNNGIRIENYQYSENHPLNINEFGLDRVEIIKGPASLLYGSDAIGGVINFIKEKPAPVGKIIGNTKLQYFSNTQGFLGDISLKGASNEINGGINIGGKSNSDYLQPGGDFVPNSRFNEWSLKTNLGLTRRYGSFNIFYDFNKQDLGMTVPASISLIQTRDRKNDIWYQDLGNHLVYSQNKLFIGNYSLDLIASFQSVIRKLQTTLTVPFVEMNLATFTYNTKLNFPSSNNTEYIIGTQGKIQKHENINNRPSQFLPNTNTKNAALYVLIQYTFIKHLKVQTGIRYDYNEIKTEVLGTQAAISRNYNNISGSIGGTYNLNTNIIFRTNFASAYRTPNLSELTSNGMHGNRFEKGNPDLTTVHTYESDFSMHYHGKHISFDLAGFYNIIDNYIFISPTSDTASSGSKIYKFSQSNSSLFGGEFVFHIHPRQIGWLHFETKFSTVVGKQENGDYLPFIPANKLRIELKAETDKIWKLHNPFININSLTAFKQGKVAFSETETDGYTIINAGTGFSLPVGFQKLNFNLSVNNIFDIEYYDHLSTLKPLYYNIGRNFSFSVNIPFTVL